MEEEKWPRLNEWPLHDKLFSSVTATLQAGWFQPITPKSTLTDYSKWSNSKNVEWDSPYNLTFEFLVVSAKIENGIFQTFSTGNDNQKLVISCGNNGLLGQNSRQQVRFTLSCGFLRIHSMNFIPIVCFNKLET